MKFVIAQMEHETNTFSPVPTPLERFGYPEVPRGEEALRRFRGTGTGMGGFLAVAEAEGMEIATPIAARSTRTRALLFRIIQKRTTAANATHQRKRTPASRSSAIILSSLHASIR